DPIVVAITHQQQRFSLPRIQSNPVAGVELPLFGPRPSKSLEKLALLVEFEDVIRSVPVRDEYRAVRAHRDRTWVEAFCFLFLINLRAFGIFYGPLSLTIEFDLQDLVVRWPRSINVFCPIFLTYFQAMNACRADRAQELAFRRKDHDPPFGI